MIKPTFYNLPDEKKHRLFLAAKKEFSEVSYNEASINKIIKEAEISRGSFYTYFDTKADLVRGLLEEYLKIVLEQIKITLIESDGDIFNIFTKLFDITIEYTEIKDDIDLFHSLFKTMRTTSDFEAPLIFGNSMKEKHLAYIMGMINKDDLDVNSQEELRELLDLLFSITKQSISKALSKTVTAEAARQNFLYKIEILKYGVLKKKK